MFDFTWSQSQVRSLGLIDITKFLEILKLSPNIDHIGNIGILDLYNVPRTQLKMWE